MNENSTQFRPGSIAEPFLILTSYEELWDLSRPLCFLGEHVRRYSMRKMWAARSGEVMDPWTDPEAISEAARYVGELSESWLPVIARTLNSIHGAQRSERYWRILLGNWVGFFLGALYDRFARISQALQRWPAATTITLSGAAGVVPRDLAEFFELLKGDLYNHQLYSEILRELGCNFPTRSLAVRQSAIAARQPQTPVADVVKRGLLWLSRRRLFRPRIALCSTMAPIAFRTGLCACTAGKVWPIMAARSRSQQHAIDRGARSRFKAALPIGSEFERIAAALFGEHLPQAMLEDFSGAEGLSRERYPAKLGAILSANAWYTDELFKHWAAASAERGTRLLGAQHGGNYGSVADHAFERHERSIADKYFTWGWAEAGGGAVTVPGAALKLVAIRRTKITSGQAGIVFVATHAIRYPFLLTPFEISFGSYIDWQRRFSGALPDQLRSELRVRLHAEDVGWDFEARWREWHPDVTFERWDVTFQESLRRCRIYVCDHLSTTFIEALVANKPTLLFWDPCVNPVRPSAARYYDGLRAAGILFDTPEDAATALARVYERIATWWMEPQRQAARIQFCERFARISDRPLAEWVDLLRMELVA